jgi:hypothetical protein
MNEEEAERLVQVQRGTACAGPCHCVDESLTVRVQWGDPRHNHNRSFCTHFCHESYVAVLGELTEILEGGPHKVTDMLNLADVAMVQVRQARASRYN